MIAFTSGEGHSNENTTRQEFEKLGYASEEAMLLDRAIKRLRQLTNHYSDLDVTGKSYKVTGYPLNESVDGDVSELNDVVHIILDNKHLLSNEEFLNTTKLLEEAEKIEKKFGQQ